MKNNIIIVCLLAALFAACSPMEQNRIDLKSVISKTDLKFQVTQKAGYDNMVYLQNLTPGVLPYWDFGTGTSNKQADTIIFPFAGNHTIKFYGYSAGGPVLDSTVITVTNNDPNFFSNPAWNLISNGVVGRTWVWANDNPYTVQINGSVNHYANGVGPYNDGNFEVSHGIDWWQNATPEPGEITFDLNGAANFTKTDNNGVVTQKSFFDIIVKGTGPYNVYLVLKGGATWLNDDVTNLFNPDGALRIYKLTNDELILCRLHNWGERPFYMKRKGYVYP